MTPADELRTAAQKIRDAAEMAGSRPWAADHYPEGTIVRPANSTHSLFRLAADGTRAAGTPNVAAPIGDYIATMHPAVGLALADWLEHEATGHEAVQSLGDLTAELLNVQMKRVGFGAEFTHSTLPQALAVARAILGDQP